jgi:MFS family permease
MMCLPLAMLLVAPSAGWLSDRIGTRIPASFGILLVGCGLFWLSRLSDLSTPEGIALKLSLIGLGMAFFGSPNSSAILSSVPSSKMGEASGLIALMRTAGIAFGIAFAVTAFTFFKGRQSPETIQPILHAIKPVFLLASVLVAVDLMISMTRGSRPRLD